MFPEFPTKHFGQMEGTPDVRLYYASFALSMSTANLDLMLSGSRLHCGLSTERSSVALWVVPSSSQSVFSNRVLFSSNPTLFKVVKVNVHDELETTRKKTGNRKVWIIDIQIMEGFFVSCYSSLYFFFI